MKFQALFFWYSIFKSKFSYFEVWIYCLHADMTRKQTFKHQLRIFIKYTHAQKMEFFQLCQFSTFFSKISWICPSVSRIEWCEGHWCGSTYMAVRPSDISSKTVKKWIFGLFWPFLSLCRTASRPYTLSYINALRIIQSY